MKKIWRLWLLLPLLLCLASCAKQQETAGLLWIKNFSGTEGVFDYGLTAMDEAFVLQTVEMCIRDSPAGQSLTQGGTSWRY